MDIKILTVNYKENYRMPEGKMYYPIQVGRAEKNFEGHLRDNTGDNIAHMNVRLCELTVIYWAWKNLKADYIGLVHYRRHFTGKNLFERLICKDKFQCVLSKAELEKELKACDVIVPNKRKYYIETMESHYLHLPFIYEKDYRVLRDVISKLCPEYLDSYDLVFHRTWAHMFNIFVMKRDLFDRYCEWLFPILFECDKRIDVTGYTPEGVRAVGYYGEYMLDIWMEKNKIPYKEIDVMFMEKQNWIKKGGTFLIRKFFPKKVAL